MRYHSILSIQQPPIRNTMEMICIVSIYKLMIMIMSSFIIIGCCLYNNFLNNF